MDRSLHIVVSGVTAVGKSAWAAALGSYLRLPIGRELVLENSFRTRGIAVKSRPDLVFLAQWEYLTDAARQQADARLRDTSLIQDHSVYEVVGIYARRLKERGLLGRSRFDHMADYLAAFRSVVPPPDLIVLLYARSEVVVERIHARCRPGDVVPSTREIVLAEQRRRALWADLGVPAIALDTSCTADPREEGSGVSELWQRALKLGLEPNSDYGSKSYSTSWDPAADPQTRSPL